MTKRKSRRPTRVDRPSRKQSRVPEFIRRLPRFAKIGIALAIVGVVVAVVLIAGQPPGDNTGKPRAAIVDQLYNLQPNDEFVANVTAQLEEYGFEVDLYQGDDIDVRFYRGLASRGHKLIIFRVHAGLVIENGGVSDRTLLFTNEEYSTSRYPAEQISDRLAKGSAGEGHPVMFAITPGFIASSTSMSGAFDDTAIIMMGCSALYYNDLARAFIGRGASVYLGWYARVLLHYVDEATPYLLRQLCYEEATIKEAIIRTMDPDEGIGLDPQYQAALAYYPTDTAGKTLAELLQMVVDTEGQTAPG